MTVHGHIQTTRLMAFTLHREHTADTLDRSDLYGLLEIATTSASVNGCDPDVGDWHDFERLTLTPDFAHAMLVDKSNYGYCFAPADFLGTTIFSLTRSGCAKWSLNDGPTHQVLTDSSEKKCVVMNTVPNHPNVNTRMATIVDYDPLQTTGCLQFIYRLDPYSTSDVVPTSGKIDVHPLTSNAAFIQDPNYLETREIQDLTVGYLGTADPHTGALKDCLFWNSRAPRDRKVTTFELTSDTTVCTQLHVTYFHKF